jgi:hypothetical protein
MPLREYEAARGDTGTLIVYLEHADSAVYQVLAVGHGYCVVHRVDV